MNKNNSTYVVSTHINGLKEHAKHSNVKNDGLENSGKKLCQNCSLIVYFVCLLYFQCPNTVQILHPFTGCYPFYDEDPYILSECPHILFAGNQPHLKHRIHKGMVSN